MHLFVCFQLCETLKRDCPKVHIAAIEIADEGICIRFAPMESIHGKTDEGICNRFPRIRLSTVTTLLWCSQDRLYTVQLFATHDVTWTCTWFADYDTTEAEVDDFLATLDRQLSILDATVRQRAIFQEIVAAQEQLRIVHLPHWAGLGAIQ